MPSHVEKQEWILAALANYELRLLRFALRLVRDEHAARDIVQQAYLKLCRETPETFSDEPARWLFTVVRNASLDFLRKRNHHEQTFDHDSAVPFEPIDAEPTPSHVIEQRETWTQVRKLVDQLPFAQREALLLWSEDFSYAQIAEMTSRNEGDLRVSVHRALATLRSHPGLREQVEKRESRVKA
jgi:RNA polymerase sigma-70 factor (ECF subfamily)